MQTPNPGLSDLRRPSGDSDGVDDTLIEWMLSLTPMERLEVLQQFIDSVFQLRHASTSETPQDTSGSGRT